jgi:transglycosylase-like protein with SLT domain
VTITLNAVFAGVIALAVSAGVGLADTPSFKRVKPLTSSSRNLINIQVEPVAPVERVLSYVPDIPAATPEFIPPPATTMAPGGDPGGKTGWFWSSISPSLSAARSGRLLAALQIVSRHPGESAARIPKLDHLSKMAADYGEHILKATSGTRVSPALVLAVMSAESGGKASAKSSAGAVGLMQLMPATAKRFGVTDRTDPVQSIRGGVKYLDFLLAEFNGDALLALAGYNAGEGAVRSAGGVPNYAETRAYVPKVVAAWSQARLLCMTPPNRAMDSCLFRGVRVASQ